MKKIVQLLFTFLLVLPMQAQLNLTNNGDGTVTIEYGANNDFSLYDPQGDTQVFVYLWVNADQTNPNLANVYNDDWNDIAGMVSMMYDSMLQMFVGVIDFNNHNFSGEGVLPSNVNLENFNLILRNQAGDRQSADLLATDYGFQPTVSLEEIDANELSYFHNGKLFIKNDNQQYTYRIFDINGSELQHGTRRSPIIDLTAIQSKAVIISVEVSEKGHFVRKIILE